MSSVSKNEKILVIVKADNPTEAKEKAIKIMDKYIAINNKTYNLTHRDLFIMCNEIILQNFRCGDDQYYKYDKYLGTFAAVCKAYNLEYDYIFGITNDDPTVLPTWKQYDEIIDDDIIPPNTPIDPENVPDLFVDIKNQYLNFNIHKVCKWYLRYNDSYCTCDKESGQAPINKFNFITLPEIQSCYFVKVCVKN